MDGSCCLYLVILLCQWVVQSPTHIYFHHLYLCSDDPNGEFTKSNILYFAYQDRKIKAESRAANSDNTTYSYIVAEESLKRKSITPYPSRLPFPSPHLQLQNIIHEAMRLRAMHHDRSCPAAYYSFLCTPSLRSPGTHSCKSSVRPCLCNLWSRT